MTGRRIVLALALGAGAALALAVVATWQASVDEGYWASGTYRLLIALVTERFDRWAPVAIIVALLPLLRVRPGPGSMTVALAALVLVGGLRVLAALDAWRAGRGPNVVLISIDTLRADHLGAYGYALPTSPTLDRRLAAAGVTFEVVYSQSPKTTPSHMTMLTSLDPAVHGVELWDGTAEARTLSPAVQTLAEVLRNAGYATAAFTGGAYLDGAFGFRQGFETYEMCDGNELGRARQWLHHHSGRKFFLFFHTYQVHDPYVPPLEIVDRFDTEYQGKLRDTVKRLRADEVPWAERERVFWASVDRNDPRDARFLAHLYDAGIRHMDGTTLAPLLDEVEARSGGRDTLVVFTSDHGEAFGEHGAFLHDDLYSGTLRVPLVVRFPGHLPPGTRVTEPARLLDVMPTILDLLGVPPPAGLQGRSLVPAMRGAASADHAPLVSNYSSTRSNRTYLALRRDALSYILDGASEQLFDLARDPGEQENVAAREPAAVAAMRTELARWRAACLPLEARFGARSDGVVPSEATVRQLRALGYVQ